MDRQWFRQARLQEHVFTVRLQGSRWSYLALEVTGYKSPAGWDFCTRVEIIIPRNSLVFSLVKGG